MYAADGRSTRLSFVLIVRFSQALYSRSVSDAASRTIMPHDTAWHRKTLLAGLLLCDTPGISPLESHHHIKQRVPKPKEDEPQYFSRACQALVESGSRFIYGRNVCTGGRVHTGRKHENTLGCGVAPEEERHFTPLYE